MEQPTTILKKGTRVRTTKKLGSTEGMIAMPSLIANRRPDEQGAIHGIVPAMAGMSTGSSTKIAGQRPTVSLSWS